jgi:hypothetical protein
MGQSIPINRTLAILDASLVIVHAVKENRHQVAARHEAKLIVKRHPDCGMTGDEILAEIANLAVRRGLSVDTGH